MKTFFYCRKKGLGTTQTEASARGLSHDIFVSDHFTHRCSWKPHWS